MPPFDGSSREDVLANTQLTGGSAEETAQNLFSDAYRCSTAAASVVKIEGERSSWLLGTKQVSDGSGFYVSNDGLAVTDGHVVNGFNNLRVKGTDGEWHSASVVARDDANDLALLQVDSPGAVMPILMEPDSTGLTMQQHLTTVGYPGASEFVRCAEGTVDGRASVGQITTTPNPGEDVNRKVVAIAATGDEGMSGGPVLNESGRAAGIADKAATNTSRGDHIFMTPIEPVRNLVQSYLDRR